jgi:hypothetical protein
MFFAGQRRGVLGFGGGGHAGEIKRKADAL